MLQTLDNAAQINIKVFPENGCLCTKHLEEYLVQHRKNTDKLVEYYPAR